MSMQDCCAVILAAGEGKRMKSTRPKVLCEVLFEPMLGWTLSSCGEAGLEHCCVVVGNRAQKVVDYIGNTPYRYQKEQKGTAHALVSAIDFVKQFDGEDLLVLYGDSPFIDAQTIQDSYRLHKESNYAVTVITACVDNPYGYGRIIRKNGMLSEIVEEKNATQEQRQIHEINSGTYWFSIASVLNVLDKIQPNPVNGEYYLTDAIALLIEQGGRAGIYQSPDPQIVLGANDQMGLTKLNEIARIKILQKHMENGVFFVSTDGVVIAPDVRIGAGTQILPGTILKDGSIIGKDCVIGPNTLIAQSKVKDRTTVNASQVYQSVIKEDVKIGPFCHIRPNSQIDEHVKIGDFVEVKNSTVGAGTAISHLTYIGDSDVGKNVNFGCGVVTVNYDGVHKNRCKIDDGAFIGCNTNLIAPVHVGEDSYTAAGSTITEDVPGGDLGIARARQKNIVGFSKKKLKGRKKKV